MADVPERYPWRGNGIYTLEVVEYLLNVGTAAKHNVTRALQHALDIPTHVFVKADQQIMGALAEWGSSCFVFEKVVQKGYKSMQHTFMGLCGRGATSTGRSLKVMHRGCTRRQNPRGH